MVSLRSKLGRRARRTSDGASDGEDASELLARADELSERGRAIDAVRLLTEANRSRRDGRIEHRLAHLRYEAFRQDIPPQEPPPWPVVDDLWPGERVPELRPDQLTATSLHSAVEHHGSVIVRGLLDDGQVAPLVADIDRSLAAYDERTNDEPATDIAHWYEPFSHDNVSPRTGKRSRGSLMTVESPPALFDVLEMFETTGLRSLAQDYFGEPPALLARKGTLRRVSPGTFGGWHQDGAFMGEGIRSLNVWIALTDCGVDAPGLELIGRRVAGLLPTGDGAFADWGIKAPDAVACGGDDIVCPAFAAGDAMIFDHFLVHHTAFGPEMTRDRHALETWLLAPSTYGAMTSPRPDGYSPRDQIPLAL